MGLKECKKTSFLDEKQALFYVDKLKTSTRKNKPVRVYLCPYCKTWHLTSKPDRDKLIKENEILRIQIDALKNEIKQVSSIEKRQIQIAISADKRVNKLIENQAKQNKTISELRKHRNDLMNKNFILENKLRSIS